MKKNGFIRKCLSAALCIVLVLGMMPHPAFAADGQTTLDISYGNIEIGDGTVSGFDKSGNAVTTANAAGYVITGTSEEYTVTVSGGTHSITLQDASIITHTTAEPFDIAAGANVTLTLSGSSVLTVKGDNRVAALHVPRGAALTINGSGSLSASGYYSAGIGGNRYEVNGTITINSGIITARGTCGIGCGYFYSSSCDSSITSETITINGGTINATSSSGGVAIGSGTSNGPSNFRIGSVVINGGNVRAESIGLYPYSGEYFAGVKDSAGNALSLQTITLPQLTKALAITDITLSNSGSYGTVNMLTQDINKLFLFLPSNVTVLEVKTAATTFDDARGEYPSLYCSHGNNPIVYEDNGDGTHTGSYSCCGEVTVSDEQHTWDAAKTSCTICSALYPYFSVTTADGETVSYHATLESAVTAASASAGSTLKLLEKITIAATQQITSGTFTIDLNGQELSCANNTVIQTSSNTVLKVMDSVGGGKIDAGTGDYAIWNNSGTLTVESGIYKGTSAGIFSTGSIKVNDGTFTGGNGINIQCTDVSVINELNGGTFTGTAANLGATHKHAIHIGSSTAVNIKAGSFTALGDVLGIDDGAVVNISGGTFTNTDPSAAVSLFYYAPATLNISGGTFTNGITQNFGSTVTLPAIYDLLAEGCYLRNADGKVITIAATATEITDYVQVSSGANLEEAEITLSQTEYTYNGQAKEPTITVKVGGKTLTAGTHYTVDYANNINANTGTVKPTVTIKAAENTAYSGTVVKNFTINPLPVTLTWNGNVFYYTGNAQNVTATYTDVNDNSQNATVSDGSETAIGSHTATASIADTNYMISGSATHNYEIKWYDGAQDAEISGTQGKNNWYVSDVKLTAPTGYTICTTADGSYGTDITLTETCASFYYYLMQNETGYIAQMTAPGFNIDKVAPEAQITLAGNVWKELLSNITFKLFFKETQTVTITGTDGGSGLLDMDYEYCILQNELEGTTGAELAEALSNLQWQTYNGSLSIAPNSKNIVYARVTDRAGLQTIVNSNGIVVYSDSAALNETVTYSLTSLEDAEISLDMQGNAIESVTLNGQLLTQDTHYTQTAASQDNPHVLTLKAAHLETLAVGSYTVTIAVAPMGESFSDSTTGDAPNNVMVTLNVEKWNSKVNITSSMDKIYDQNPVAEPEYTHNLTGKDGAPEPVVEYKQYGADDSTYTDQAPVKAGKYTVRISTAETDKLARGETTLDFEIYKQPVTIIGTSVEASKVYDGKLDAAISSPGILSGHLPEDEVMIDTSAAIASYEDANAGTSKVVTFSGFALAGADASNYVLTAQPTAVKANIEKKDITGAVVTLGKALVYNGQKQTQSIDSVVIDGLDVTYDVSGATNTAAGTYTMTLTGNGNFTGTVSVDYTILSNLALGDSNNIWIWIGLMVCSLAALMACEAARRRRSTK